MRKSIVISEQDSIAALLENDRVVEFFVNRGELLLGDIYTATVENILPGIDAAFVNLGKDKMGFLNANDIPGQGALKERLVPKQFLPRTPWGQLQHFPRYLKAVQARLDKLRADPERDAKLLAELRPLEQRWQRRVAELKGGADARLDEYRWLLEELRVSFFAQELRTPQPVSVKRLDKAWLQLTS